MNDLRRRLPAVSTLLAEATSAGLASRVSHAVLVEAIREALSAARVSGGEPPREGWLSDIERRSTERHQPSLIAVVNATGVILHTNLGRAPLAEPARAAMAASGGYSTLELDLALGERGSRQAHLLFALRELTGAEDAFVALNAAAALLLVLNTLSDGGETIVSRGELVEIGGGFRIPEILQKSGATLVEVGTTNRTRLSDYEHAITPRTRCVLKVHRSNFQMSGFVSEASVAELCPAMQARNLPVVHDAGSGLLLSLERYGLRGEPLVRESVAAGAVVVFSGDKLLGGPQAGIIVGPATVVSPASANPLARALRPDKSTVAALESTLSLYRDPRVALAEVPVLAMLTASAEELKRRARRLARRIPDATTEPGVSSVGGGAFPEATLPTTLVAVAVHSCEEYLAVLRRHRPPVIARAHEGRVVFDVRTIADREFATVAEAAGTARGA